MVALEERRMLNDVPFAEEVLESYLIFFIVTKSLPIGIDTMNS